MDTSNPYAPPLSAVHDVDSAEHQPVRVWSAKGRIGRLRYLAHLNAAYLLIFPVTLVAGLVATVATSPRMLQAIWAIVMLAYLVFFVLKTIQRSHDMDWSGWASILAFIPIANLVLILRGGTKGANRYGAAPPPNTVGVRLLGLWLPLLTMIGGAAVIAAIALPLLQTR